MLLTSSVALSRAYDLAMLDLDGVVYIGSAAVPGAAGHIAGIRAEGMRVAFITNNASRPATAVADHLTELGVPADERDVVTSAQAAARLLVEEHGPGASIVCLGGAGLRVSLEQAGLVPVGVDDEAAAVASGYGPDLRWREIMRAAVRIRDGLPWLASNTDTTIPTPFGVAPGHGVLVEMLQGFTGVTPVVAGKPARPLLDETVRRVGGARPLMIGDRLDTDIEGAHNAGVDSLLVLTGVTGLVDLVAAPPALRPSYIAPDLAGLSTAHVAPQRQADGWALGGWYGDTLTGRLELRQQRHDADPADWWRVAASAAWSHLDEVGRVVDLAAARVPGDADPAR